MESKGFTSGQVVFEMFVRQLRREGQYVVRKISLELKEDVWAGVFRSVFSS